MLSHDIQPVAAIATTPSGIKTLAPLGESGAVTLWVSEENAVFAKALSDNVKIYAGSLKDHLEKDWSNYKAFIFCLATGAVTRLIAPLLRDKTSDPAVVVVDGAGEFVVSLAGGHQGGADRLARAIALQLNATPVLTGGSNELGLPGIDVLGIPFGWKRGSGDWTGVSAAIARQAPVQVIQEAGSTLWQCHLPPHHSFQFGFPEYTAELKESKPSPQARVWISPIQRQFSSEADFPKVQWHPRVLWVGVGCERNTPRSVIEAAIEQVFQANHLAQAAIAGIATIDLKADEPGLLELCRDRHLPLRCFSAEALRSISVPNPSSVVEAEVGTPSVAEAAAILGDWGLGGRESFGALRERGSGSPSERCASGDRGSGIEDWGSGIGDRGKEAARLLVPKQIVRVEGQPGAVTIAVAQSDREYTGRTGKLWLVGTGPGQLEQITPAAKTAIAEADVVIGYSLYVDLVRSLLRPGQIVEALPITQERQRAERAIELAQWGLTVAVISSGDCGIYGMAGLVLEELRSQGWDGKTPGVQVFPGITALQAAASRVGAPLMHDFCAISLSDLLTPWNVIETRLTAAAQADFVTALYNPKSKTRTEQIAIAQSIFLRYRDPQTPVAIVRSVYRPDEQIQLTTIGQLLEVTIDMLTVIVIGNQSTRIHEGWMITPRGYLGFGEN